MNQQDKRVCTCGPGYFCTFECEFCDAFKVPEALGHPGMDEEQAQETVCALEDVVHDLVHGKTHAPSQVLQSRDFDIE